MSAWLVLVVSTARVYAMEFINRRAPRTDTAACPRTFAIVLSTMSHAHDLRAVEEREHGVREEAHSLRLQLQLRADGLKRLQEHCSVDHVLQLQGSLSDRTAAEMVGTLPEKSVSVVDSLAAAQAALRRAGLECAPRRTLYNSLSHAQSHCESISHTVCESECLTVPPKHTQQPTRTRWCRICGSHAGSLAASACERSVAFSS